jgi:hypothetical protein
MRELFYDSTFIEIDIEREREVVAMENLGGLG